MLHQHGLVEKTQPAGCRPRIRDPVFGGGFQPQQRGKVQPDIIRQRNLHHRRAVKFLRVGDGAFGRDKARKNAHGARPQPKGGFQRQRGRFTDHRGKLPGGVTQVIGMGKTGIRREDQADGSIEAGLVRTHHP